LESAAGDAPVSLDRFAFVASLTGPRPGVVVAKSRAKRSTERHVFVIEDRYVVKRYRAYSWGRWWSPYWKREHDALTRLDGLPVPKTYGYFRTRSGGARDVIYARECVRGTPLKASMTVLPEALLPEVADLMAEVHRRLVIANDYSLQNLLRGDDGRLYFIDFHRARVFTRRSLWYWQYVGKDLCHLYKVSCGRDPTLFHAYLDLYFARPETAQGKQRAFMMRAFRYWCRSYGVTPPPPFTIP